MKVGFIGLGIMGKPMCHNLIKAGYELVVMDKNTESAKAFETLAVIARSPREVASLAEVIITMLPNSPHVKEVILGDNGILTNGRKGLTVIDMSSISPVVSREIYFELEKAGMDMLDAPVSGGEPKAIEGTLSVMAGGKENVFEKYYEKITNLLLER